MQEYGPVYNTGYHDKLEYPYCAYKYKECLFISEALHNRVHIVNTVTGQWNQVCIDNWFPRSIQPINYTDFLFVDSRKKTIGYVSNSKITQEYLVPGMKPAFVSLTPHHTFLVGGSGTFPLIEYDFDFNVVGRYLDESYVLQAASYIGNGNLLVCDINRHQVLICRPDGGVVWSFGKENFPGEEVTELSTPKFCCHNNKTIFIADGKNNRIMCVDFQKNIHFIYYQDEYKQNLWWPTCVDVQDKTMVISDSANNRVIEVDLHTFQSVQWGNAKVKDFMLNNPRCIEIEDDGIYLADTYNHRVLFFNNSMDPHIYYGGKRGITDGCLFWPRAVRKRPNNNICIADSRNSRIIELDSFKRIIKETKGYTLGNVFVRFQDPHDIDAYEDKILITDSELNCVVELDEKGFCTWCFGTNGELSNPHHGRRTPDGNILISDTGNNRIVKISRSGEVIYQLHSTNNGVLREPRWAEEVNEYIMVTDSGNNRIILVDTSGKIHKSFQKTLTSQIKSIRAPRCVRINRGKLIISDTYNNRLLIEDCFNL